jgi:hypothetical protein
MSAFYLIQECFFKELSLQQFLNFVTDKNIKNIISLVHNVVKYVTSNESMNPKLHPLGNFSQQISGEFNMGQE